MDAPPAPGLYVHVPFCAVRCAYCGFVTGVHPAPLRDRYLAALERELAQAACVPATPFRTLYVGGGSPSSLEEGQWSLLWDLLAPAAEGCVECTVEINPCQASPAKLARIEGLATRVSLGVQTWQPMLRRVLGRVPEDPGCVAHAVEQVRGRFHMSLDIIHSVPGQTRAMLEDDLDRVAAAAPDHVSAYALSLEEGTPLAEQAARGAVRMPSDTFQAEALWIVRRRLAAQGYAQYEISNFARPGRECLHNLATWAGREYVGIGAGACSYVDGERRRNTPDVEAYIRAIEARGEAVIERERLEGRRRAGELAMLSLRTRRGIDIAAFREATGIDPVELCPHALEAHVRDGLVDVTGDVIRLTARGLDWADRVCADFV